MNRITNIFSPPLPTAGWINIGLSFILLFLWFHTALDKFADLWTFEVNLGRQPLPEWSITPLTYAVPVVEMAIGILLFFPKTRRLGFLGSAVLMAIFTLYVALGLAQVLGHLPCACSKIISSLSWRAHLWLNIVLLLLSVVGWWSTAMTGTPTQSDHRESRCPDQVGTH